MNINANYEIVELTGTMDLLAMGYGLTSGSSVHQVYCTSDGSITLNALGGGEATLTMTAGQSIDVLLSGVIVNSGAFIGFRSKSNVSYLSQGYTG